MEVEQFELMTATQIEELFEKVRGMSCDEMTAFVSSQESQLARRRTQYFLRYVERECATAEERENLVGDVESFWTRLKKYEKEDEWARAFGLAVGRIQSGKTRNYIGLMFKAIDEGFNTIIILTSKSNLLAQQTHDRVFGWMSEEKGLGVSNCNALTRTGLKGDQTGIVWVGGEFSPRRINVGVVIKNVSGHLRNVKNWLEHLSQEQQKSMRMLFIDDESDAATPDTHAGTQSVISSDADVDRVAGEVLRRAKQCAQMGVFQSSALKYEAAARWMVSLNKAEIHEQEASLVREWLSTCRDRDLLRSLRENAAIQKALQVGADRAVELVFVFDHEHGRYEEFTNRKVFRDYLNYVFGVERERSRINNIVSEIVSVPDELRKPAFDYGRMVYVGYTATPFANLLNEDPTKDPLCPDCIKPLSVSSKYFGLERIFGVEPFYGAVESSRRCRMNVVRTIPEAELEHWIHPLQDRQLGDDVLREGLCRDGVEWKSLTDAVKWAFCTAAARRVRRLENGDASDFADKKSRWTTMLFNVSHLADQDAGVHIVQQRIVQAYLASMLGSLDQRGKFLSECMNLWNEQTSAFSAEDFNQACPGYGLTVSYPEASKVEKELRDWFLNKCSEKVRVIQMNAATDDRDGYGDPNSGNGGDVLWIVCGGNAISRGLTLDGLTVSYYDRIKNTTAVDTITQMGRWFGYRLGYELLPRIWMSDDTVTEMKKICRIEVSLHAELRNLFDDDDTTSLRDGREVANVLYLGRRLSSRDANGAILNGVESKGVFDYVKSDPAPAFDATRDFLLKTLGLGNVWKKPATGFDRPLHARHRYMWDGVNRSIVADYLRQMCECCFASASLNNARGLVREIADSTLSWRVVVGSPDEGMLRDVVALRGIDGVDVHCRNNQVTPQVDGVVRVGHGTQTVQAYLAWLPSDVISRAEDTVRKQYRSGSNLDGKMTVVGKAYEIADEKTPVLLIDFVNGGDNGAYVQVSFLWHGHSQERFFRAMIDKALPTVAAPTSSPMVRAILDVVAQQHYVAKSVLKRKVAEKRGLDDREFGQVLESLCQEGAIGRVTEEDGRAAVVSPDVVYGNEWYAENHSQFAQSPAETIGYDLYKKIDLLKDRYGSRRCFEKLREEGYGRVMAYEDVFGTPNYEWNRFEEKYAQIDQQTIFWGSIGD